MTFAIVFLWVIGLALLSFGILEARRFYLLNKANDIAVMGFHDSKLEFNIEKPGLYAVCVLGGLRVKNKGELSVSINDLTNQTTIELKKQSVKYMFTDRIWMEVFHFEVENIGDFKLEISSQEQIEVKRSIYKLFALFESPSQKENLLFAIRETRSKYLRALSGWMVVVGVLSLFWAGVMTFLW